MKLNERGILTVDFLFSMVLIFGLGGLLFVLSFTLSVASMTQYVTFAMARNYTAAHVTQELQKDRANAKYRELINNPVLKPLYSNGWYTVDEVPGIGDHTLIIPQFREATDGVNKFWGAGTALTARVLAFSIPFFGSTTPDTDGSGDNFKTYIGSYLGRESTTEECLALTAQRWATIRNLQVTGGAAYSQGTSDNGYFPMSDNGC